MYKGKFVLKNLTEEELKDFLVEIGEKKFRGSQIYSWIYRNIWDFDEMNNI
ncbi:MAG: 23S rRNA (adenine(2503)-C(2))-methyltransferase RlmN, partial [Peptostreptococcus stomatis]